MKNKLIPVFLLIFLLFSCYAPVEPLVFRIGVTQIPDKLDPQYMDSPDALIISSALFEGLVVYNETADDFVPAAADSWEFEDDGKLVRFNLGVGLWSDGSRITASQYVDSWQRLLHPSNTSKWAYSLARLVKGAADYHNGAAGFDAVGLRAVDHMTLEVAVAGSWRDLFHLLSYPALSVMPLHIIEKHGQDWSAPENIVINGPFNFDLKAEGTKLVRNPLYSKSIYIDEIELHIAESLEDALFLYNEGQVDWLPHSVFSIDSTDLPDSADIIDAEAELDVLLNGGLEHHFLLFNAGSGFLKDAGVRKAVSLTVENLELAEAADMLSIEGLLPVAELNADAAIFKTDTAMALLAESAYAEASNFPVLRYVYPESSANTQEYEILKKQLKDGLGLSLQGKALDWDTYLKYLYTGNYDIAKCSWKHNISSPYGIIKQFHSLAEFYSTGYENKDVDELIRIAESTVLNGSEHVGLLNEAQIILLTVDQLLIPLYVNKRFNRINTDIWAGWEVNVQDVHPVRWISRNNSEDM